MADEDLSRPYVGYRSAGRRPESQQDRRAAADAPLSALRGAVSGVLGAPGDIESLIRMLPGLSERTVLPTSEDVEKRLPLPELNRTPTGRAFTTAGQLGGGFYGGPGSPLRAIAALPSAVSRAGRDFMLSSSPAYVIKPKGGNWLAGQSERITHQLRRQEPYGGALPERIQEFRYTPEEAELIYAGAAPERAYNTWIDKKLGNYVRNEMATPEDPLRAMAEKWATEKPQRLAEADAKLEALNAKTLQLMQERGVPEEYLTRHRQDVLKAEKARDLIEARQALHAPMQVGWEPTELAAKRLQQGFPSKGMGESDAARAWEQAADEAIGVGPAGKRFQATPSGTVWGGHVLQENPWLTKVPPETPTYTGYGLNELGFEHLTDELLNALNPNSGLPAELLMKYSDLPKKTVPDVVERVADINAWRAAQKSEADLAKANSAAVVTHKEYPEQGLAWKQITTGKHSIDKLPEGWRMEEVEGSVPGKTIFGVVDSKGHLHPEAAGKSPDTPEAAYENFSKGFGKKELEDALKYEGDMMRHCVGGYCPDVSSGRSQIFSLRDERGRPHVTIEVKPGRGDPVSERFKDLEPEVIQQIRAQAEARDPSGKPWGPQGEFLPGDVAERHRDLMREVTLERFPEWANLKPADEIAQIKGLDNGPPDAKYLPQVQDFVKSGNWSEVRDLDHAGLYSSKNIMDFMPEGFQMDRNDRLLAVNRAKMAGELPSYLSRPEYEEILKKYAPEGVKQEPEGFAAGGYVEYDPAQVDVIMQRTRAGFAEGGAVNAGNEPLAYDPTKISSIVAQLHEELNNGY